MADIEERLDPFLASLVSAEKDRPDPPSEATTRVMDRLAVTLGPSGGGAPPTGPANPSAPPAPASAASANSGGSGSGGASPLSAAAHAGSARTWTLFVVGIVLGAGGHALLERVAHGPQQVSSSSTPATQPPPAPAPAEVPLPSPSRPSSGDAPATRPRPVTATPSEPSLIRSTGETTNGASPPAAALPRASTTPDASLRAERKIIEIARTALGRGQLAGALEHLRRHARQFPTGELAEEREALMIQALAAHEDVDEARARADRFRTRFPHSLFAPAVDAAVRSLP